MKITTLRTGALTLSTVKYKFNASGYLSIELTTSDNHKIYGDIDITLANVKNINIYGANENLIENFFNKTFSFTRTSDTQLVSSQNIKSGIEQSESFITLPNSGTSITATVANSFFDLKAGTYNFNLLDTADSDFSTSLISIKELNLGQTNIDGLESVFDKEGLTDYLSINGQDLTFKTTARVSIKNNNSNVTNIPLVIY